MANIILPHKFKMQPPMGRYVLDRSNELNQKMFAPFFGLSDISEDGSVAWQNNGTKDFYWKGMGWPQVRTKTPINNKWGVNTGSCSDSNAGYYLKSDQAIDQNILAGPFTYYAIQQAGNPGATGLWDANGGSSLSMGWTGIGGAGSEQPGFYAKSNRADNSWGMWLGDWLPANQTAGVYGEIRSYCITRDATGGTIRFYRDGIALAQTYVDNTSIPNAKFVYINYSGYAAGAAMVHTLLRWNRCLNAQEILELDRAPYALITRWPNRKIFFGLNIFRSGPLPLFHPS